MSINSQLFPENYAVYQYDPDNLGASGQDIRKVAKELKKKIPIESRLKSKECMRKYGIYPGQKVTIPLENEMTLTTRFIGGNRFNTLYFQAPKGEKYSFDNVKDLADLTSKGFQANPPSIVEIFPSDPLDVAKKMNQIFQMQIGCDVFFKVEGELIGGHTFFLKESNSYFTGLLNPAFKEGNIQAHKEKVIDISGCNAKIFRMILAYFYSGEIQLEEDNIIEIAHLANQWGVEKVQIRCKKKLIELLNLNKDNALTCFNSLYQIDFYKAPLKKFVHANIDSISLPNENIFSHLSKEALLSLIQVSEGEKLNLLFLKVVFLWIKESKIEKEEIKEIIDQVFSHLSQENIDTLPLDCQTAFNELIGSEIKETFDEAMQLAPKNLLALRLYAHALHALKRFKEAKANFEEILGIEQDKLIESVKVIEPHNIFAFNRYADTLLQLKQFEKSNLIFSDILLKKVPDSEHLFALIGYAKGLYAIGNLKKACIQYEQILKLDPNNIPILIEFAKSLYKQDKLVQANWQCRDVLKLDRKNIYALNLMEIILGKKNERVQADDKFKQILEIDLHQMGIEGLTVYIDFLMELFEFERGNHSDINRILEAENAIAKLLDLDPENIYGLKRQAELFSIRNKPEKALECFEKLLELKHIDPSNQFFALIKAANICEQLKDFEQAVVYYQKAEPLQEINDPFYILNLKNFADVLCKIKKFSEAKFYLEKIVKLQSKPSDVWTDYTQTAVFKKYVYTLCLLKDLNEARQTFQLWLEGQKSEKQKRDAICQYGTILSKAGYAEESTFILQKFLKDSPSLKIQKKIKDHSILLGKNKENHPGKDNGNIKRQRLNY